MEFITNMDPLLLGLIVGLFTVAMLFSGIPIAFWSMFYIFSFFIFSRRFPNS
jgi:hypothetical protein